MSAKEL